MLDDLILGARKNPIWFGAVGLAVGVQGWLGWRFWGSLSDDPMEGAALRALGVGLVGAEVVALDMVSRAWLRDDRVRAGVLSLMWLWFAGLNLGADVNSFTRVLEARDTSRTIASNEQAASARERAALAADIARAETAWGSPLLPKAAYDARLVAKDREIVLAEAAPNWRRRQLERERGEIVARLAAIKEIEGKRVLLTGMDRVAAQQAPVKAEASEFRPLADALGALGLFGKPAPEEVRAGAALFGIIAMKLLLTFGIFAGLERARPGATVTRRDAHAEDDQSPDRETADPSASLQPAHQRTSVRDSMPADEPPVPAQAVTDPALPPRPVRSATVTPLRIGGQVPRFGEKGKQR